MKVVRHWYEGMAFLPQGAWSLKRRSIFICLNDFPNPLHPSDSLSGERDSLTWLSNSFLCQIAFKVRKHSNIIHLNRSGFNSNPFPLALPLSLWRETFVMELHFRTFHIIQDSNFVLSPSFLPVNWFQFLQYFTNFAHSPFNLVHYSINHSTAIHRSELKRNSWNLSVLHISSTQ